MKVRIDEVGYENYTGQLGLVVFENGVSVNDVSSSEINRVSVVIRLIDADSAEQIGSLVELGKNIEVEFPVNQSFETEADKSGAAMIGVNDDIPFTISENYSREQLEALADKGGINSLREIAAPLDVKGTSITGLIGDILNKLSLKK